MPLTLLFKHEAVQALRTLNPLTRRTIKAYLKKLANDPNPGKALQDELAGYRSDRIGKYRVIFVLTKQVFEVHYVGHRKDVYGAAARILQHRRAS